MTVFNRFIYLITVLLKIILIFGFLYLFICALGFLSNAFKLVGGNYFKFKILMLFHCAKKNKSCLPLLLHVFVIKILKTNSYRFSNGNNEIVILVCFWYSDNIKVIARKTMLWEY